MTRYLRPALLALFLILTACVSDAHGQGWPGERNAVPAQSARNFFNLSTSLLGDSFGRLRVSEPVIEGDAKFTSDLLPLRFGTIATILALELNQQGGATTALCSLKWEALQ